MLFLAAAADNSTAYGRQRRLTQLRLKATASCASVALASAGQVLADVADFADSARSST